MGPSKEQVEWLVRQGQIEKRKALYKPGARVVLCGWTPKMTNDYKIVPTGTEGTVTDIAVDGVGTVHVKWDNGSSLGVTLEDDLIRIS